ncbi:ferric-dicitrate binding protein FerR (iron transport regulator) [Filimonas zeae]|nr:FecR family protein [Filimonas zeae]MDR6341402.1 ferric-dicitrate binding protein FerR (iron transport regulator) [Filimonas zeae]
MTKQRMDISEELLERFFKRTCTAEEATAVSDYLYEYPHVLDAWFEQEWEEAPQPLTAEEYVSMLQGIRGSTVVRAVRMRWLRTAGIAAAAAVLMVVCGKVWQQQQAQQHAALSAAAAQKPKKWELRTNTYGRVMQLRLQEDAVAQLQPGAVIRFQRQADESVREVHMCGNIRYKVAGNRLRAFTVYAGNVATTVLGTEFNVKEDSMSITVTLYEGKVMVKPVTPTGEWQQPVYLKPGQSLVFNKSSSIAKLLKTPADKVNHRQQLMEEDTIDLSPVNITGSGYSFRNQPLKDVFATLEQLYSVQIDYKGADLKNVYFIGSFEKTDSIETILNNIVLLKELQIQHKGNTYIITGKSR